MKISNIHTRTGLLIGAVGLLALFAIIGLGPLQSSQGSAFDRALAIMVLTFVGIVSLVVTSYIMAEPDRPARFRMLLRGHPFATALLLLGVTILIIAALTGGAILPEDAPFLLGQLTWIMFSWLLLHWRAAEKPAEIENRKAVLRRYRALFTASFALALLIYGSFAVFIPVWASLKSASTFLSPLCLLVWVTSLNGASYLNGPLDKWTTRKAVGTVFFIPVLASLYLWFGIMQCDRVDCGGWLLRSATPAPWTEQLRVADEAARQKDAAAKLHTITAKLDQYQQPPKFEYLVIETTFSYVKSNGRSIDVNLQDTALGWKRETKDSISWGSNDVKEAAEFANIVPQIKISPSDAIRSTLDEGLATGVKRDDLSARVTLFIVDSRSGAEFANSNAAWEVRYNPYSQQKVTLWVDVATGSVVKRKED